MKKEQLITKKGFSLVEVIIAVSVFSIIVTGLMGAFVYAYKSSVISGKKSRAVFWAEEGLEAVRSIRDRSFNNLVDGTHGLAISGNQWIFSGTEDVTDIFTRSVDIGAIDSDTRKITSNISWEEQERTYEVSLVSYLTNWKKAAAAGSCSFYCQSIGYSDGVCRQNSKKCTQNGETYEQGGDQYCPQTGSQNNCCCSG